VGYGGAGRGVCGGGGVNWGSLQEKQNTRKTKKEKRQTKQKKQKINSSGYSERAKIWTYMSCVHVLNKEKIFNRGV